MPKTDKSIAATTLCWSLPGRALQRFALTMSCAVSTSLAAAQGAVSLPTTSTAPALPIVGHWFGDTATHYANVLSFDPATEFAQVYLRQPKHLIVLAVIPGKGIEVISPGDTKASPMGKNVFALFMTRFENTISKAQSNEAQTDQRIYQDCLNERARIARENQSARTATRDAEGKVVAVPKAMLQPLPVCTPPTTSAIPVSAKRQLPPRPAAERYLVVMTSSADISATELDKRLRALTTTANSVAQTIEGIAAGIYAGFGGTYGGTWIDW